MTVVHTYFYTASETFLHKSGNIRTVDWNAGLAMTGRVRDIEQNVLPSSF
jgi:hypothetical protein